MSWPEPSGDNMLLFFQQITDRFPSLSFTLMIGIFFSLSIIGYSIQKSKEGSKANLFVWMSVIGLFISIASVFLFVSGLMTWYYLGILLVIEVLLTLWLMVVYNNE